MSTIKNERLAINPEKFAYAVVNNFQSKTDDKQQIAKDHLTLYLQSYYLINQFNQLELNQFSYFEDKDMQRIYTSLAKMTEHQ